ncbi:hypothetical protein LGH82_05610 [Mesorhizobium sp. PAMC28654]|uniref:hypothetical protein n=1 Tax=Mesorhizobium sp. PAMC28654 TaxID=2880934 RepID=UPI001D0AD608|nr:hypothetical protein [Mesorhizobium sp. PAMC28654]UDL90783.1 hypothetical protein LGH82_05610 [Mesorhizobium sp. PAMC28654]
MSTDHAVVWLEFRTAKVFLFEDTAMLSVTGEPELIRDKRLTHDGQNGQRRDDDFFGDVLGFLEAKKKWIIIGNRSSCVGLLERICHQKTEGRVACVEFVDAVTAEEVLLRARRYCRDRRS